MTLETHDGAGASSPSATPISVIFISSGGAARSPMAEALLREQGGARFEVMSAGVAPREIEPMTIRALEKVGIETAGAMARPVGAFLGRRFDYVVTVCDRARVTCPVFPGGLQTLHWGIDDPGEATGTDPERQAAYDRALRELAGRIHAFVPLALAAAR